jgi:hypothetical protein
MDSTSRRRFLRQAGVGLVATGGLRAVNSRARAADQRANGSGWYLLGPFAHALDPGKSVFLTSDFGFDETMAFCKIATNYDPLLFPTAKLGVVKLGAHELFMEMRSSYIDKFEVTMGANGPQATFSGGLRSETRLFSGDKLKTIIEEDIDYSCDAYVLGPQAQAQITATNFSMSVHFDPTKDHASIFGEQPTFAGHTVYGNIIVQAAN